MSVSVSSVCVSEVRAAAAGRRVTRVAADLVGTPGYLAPELLRANMIETAPGYRFEVDT